MIDEVLGTFEMSQEELEEFIMTIPIILEALEQESINSKSSRQLFSKELIKVENEKFGVEEPITPKELGKQNNGICENIQVLIVDDSSFSRCLIKKELNEIGIKNHQIQQSGNGADAVSKIKLQQFDLFILDVVMEGIDGISVLKEVKKNQHNAKIIMCSSSNSDELIKELINLGIDVFVGKPYKSETFKMTVCRTLHMQLEYYNSMNDYWVAKCHICDRKMIGVNLINTVGFFCPNNCMKIGPLANALVTQNELDKDYEKAIKNRKNDQCGK